MLEKINKSRTKKKMTSPSPRDFISNLRSGMPWRKKLRLLLENNLLKLKNFQNCCGHPGEPGC
jgi:hypothetical protein